MAGGVKTWVGLLRGVNVGSSNRIAMADLRAATEQRGHARVRTHLQSGNVLLDSEADEPALVADLEEVATGLLSEPARVLVRSADELAQVVAGNPFATSSPEALHVLFLDREPAADVLGDVEPSTYAPDAFAVGPRALYLSYGAGSRDSRLARLLTERRLGATGSARNWRTTTALLELSRGARR